MGANILHRPQTFLSRARTFFKGRKHFFSSAKGGRKHFSAGHKHFHLRARSWRKVLKVRPFQKQNMQGAKQSPRSKSKGKK
jgi:hypothetical protein